MKWALLKTAPNQLTAEMWRGLLVNNGIHAMLRPQDSSSFLGVSWRPCGLLVFEDRLEEARAILEGEGAKGEDDQPT
ncbi:MAG: DUF2007 domain-containing protein [Dehalococcoidia bacterium]